MADDESPIAGRRGEEEDDGQDELPDWRQFAKFAKLHDRGGGHQSTTEAFIPRRGEKDFEPNQIRLDQQTEALSESRHALFTALSAGIRGHSSRDHVKCIWHAAKPEIDDVMVKNGYSHIEGSIKGVMFTTIGRWNKKRQREELTSEETLYLIERGTVECWSEREEEDSKRSGSLPMTVQWAFSEITKSALKLEQYQVYAHLKRLGYAVVRKELVDLANQSQKLQKPQTKLSWHSRASNGFINWHWSMTIRLIHFLCLVQSTFLSVHAIVSSTVRNQMSRITARSDAVQYLTRSAKPLIGAGIWTNYDSMFVKLRSQVTRNIVEEPKKGVRKPNEDYKVLYYVYKPNTRFTKSCPPPPDFQVCVVNAETTLMPDMFDMQDVFDEVHAMAKEPQRRDLSLAWPPLWAAQWVWNTLTLKHSHGAKRANVYPKLKGGTSNVIVAVVDNGVISFVRFAETNFDQHPIAGHAR